MNQITKDKLKQPLFAVCKIYGYAGTGNKWIAGLELIVGTVIGIKTNVVNAAAAFFIMKAAEGCIGYMDIHYLHATAFLNDWLTRKTPSNVKVLDERGALERR